MEKLKVLGSQIGINSWDIYGDKRFFWGKTTNKIYSYNMIQKSLDVFSELSSFDLGRKNDSFLDTCIYKDKMYLSPLIDKRLCCIDLLTKEVIYYELKPYEHISKIIPYENNLFLIGASNKIRIFNIIDKKFSCIEMPNSIEPIFRREVYRENDKVYFGINCEDSIAELNLKNKSVTKIKVPIFDGNFFSTINKFKNCFWMTGQKKNIIKWCIESNSVEKIDISEYIDERETGPFIEYFSRSLVIDKYLFLAPVHSCNMLRVNLLTGETKKILSLAKDKVIWFISEFPNKQIYVSVEYICLSKVNRPVTDLVIDIEGNIIERKIIRNKNNQFIIENEYDTLCDFISDIKFPIQ